MAVFERQLLLEIHPFVTEPLVLEEGQGFLRETLGIYTPWKKFGISPWTLSTKIQNFTGSFSEIWGVKTWGVENFQEILGVGRRILDIQREDSKAGDFFFLKNQNAFGSFFSGIWCR